MSAQAAQTAQTAGAEAPQPTAATEPAGHATSTPLPGFEPREIPTGLPATSTQTVEAPLRTRVRAPVIQELVKGIEEVRVTPVIEREIVRVEIQQIVGASLNSPFG